MSTTSTSLSAADSHEEEEDASTQRRRLTAVWLAAGSAVAFMVGASWYDAVVQTGGLPPGGDMMGHAAAAEWLRTLPWWDWRGWSDWFYGGQAIGINYPPLSHTWMRFTHPAHGQMAAVALGLLVLLPWGALRLARAVGYPPRLQRIAVGAVLVLTATSGTMHWALSGFHPVWTFFGSWPAMLSAVIGLFTAAWAARCRRPVSAGIVAGVALLCNATLIPGWAAIWVVLLATSGASFRQGIRWAVTAGAAGLAVSGWWLVPFLDSWDRLVRWEVALHQAWSFGSPWQPIVLAALVAGATWAAKRPGSARRLTGAAAAGLGATLLADWTGWLRPERWMTPAILIAAIACASLAVGTSASPPPERLRTVWKLHAALGLVVFLVLTLRLEVLPLIMGLLFLPPRSWAWIGALAWSAILFWGGLWGVTNEAPEPSAESPLDAAVERSDPHASGLVYLDGTNVTPKDDLIGCSWGKPWVTTASTEGYIRPLFGLYRETSHAAEFIDIETLMGNQIRESDPVRPHWFEAWQEAGNPPLGNGPAMAEALGARWHATCGETESILLTDLAGVTASGVTVDAYLSEDAWHRAAAQWWIPIAAGHRVEPESWNPVPIRSEADDPERPPDRAATGVWLRADGDRLTVGAEKAGWAWLRVPWDPYWQAPTDSAAHKGGPGHLVIWVPEEETALVWQVPTAVDLAAAGVTGGAALLVFVMAIGNRRRRSRGLDSDRPRPVRAAIGLYADTVDDWLRTVGRWVRPVGRASRSERSVPAPADAAALAEDGSRVKLDRRDRRGPLQDG